METTPPDKPKKKKSNRLPKIISREDAKKLLAVPNIKTTIGLRNRTILQAMYRCGLRVSEICALTINDVDMEKGFLFIQLGKGKKDRYVPVDPETIEWIARWGERRPDDTDFLFPSLKGTALDQRYIREMVYRCARKAGVYIQNGKEKKLPSCHTLRHCCMTELLEEKFNIREVQEIAGHSNITTTSIYLSVRPEQLAAKMRARAGVNG